MYWIRIYLLALIPMVVICTDLHGQFTENGRDKPVDGRILAGGLGYGYFRPAGDLADRYGNNLAFNVLGHYVTSGNAVLGMDFTYMFGDNVKEDVVASFRSKEGYFLGDNGLATDLFLRQRGFTLTGQGGYLFPLSKKSRTGIMVLVGAGILQHQVRILDDQNAVAQLRGDLRKGYDRLTRGFTLSQDIMYTHLSSNHRINLKFGLTCFQGWTDEVRAVNFDTGLPTLSSRLDLGFGLKAVWLLPFYISAQERVYY